MHYLYIFAVSFNPVVAFRAFLLLNINIFEWIAYFLLIALFAEMEIFFTLEAINGFTNWAFKFRIPSLILVYLGYLNDEWTTYCWTASKLNVRVVLYFIKILFHILLNDFLLAF